MKSRALAIQRRHERRRQRRQARASSAASPPSSAATEDDEDAAVVRRFIAALVRWNAHRGDELHELCPICSGRIIISPRPVGGFDASHVEPTCGLFVVLLMSAGAGNLRTTTRNVA